MAPLLTCSNALMLSCSRCSHGGTVCNVLLLCERLQHWNTSRKGLQRAIFLASGRQVAGGDTVRPLRHRGSLTHSLYRITLHQPATGVSAAVIEGMIGGALNDDLFAKLQASARSNPEAEAQAEGVTIPLRGKEIANLSREQLLQKSASRLADILYYEGVDAGEAYFQDLTPDEGAPPSADQDPRNSEDEGLQLEMLAL